MLHLPPTPQDASPASRRALLAVAALLALLACSGCAKLTAAHLQRAYVENGVEKKLYTKMFRLEYTPSVQTGQYVVSGSALPIKENLPTWADTVDDMSLTAYLCDEHGAVLAKATQNFTRQRIGPGGIPFKIELPKTAQPSGGYFLSFGYVATFVPGGVPAGGGPGSGGIAGRYVYFVNEQAVLAN